MLKFVVASVFTWFIGTQIAFFAEYMQLCSDSLPEKVAVEVEPMLPAFSRQFETKNDAALQLQLSELTEKLKIRQRKIAYFFFANIEQDHFPDKVFSEVFVIDDKGEINISLTAKYKSVSREKMSLDDTDKTLINNALEGQTQLLKNEKDFQNMLAFPLNSKDGKILGALYVREKVPFTWFDAATKSSRDFLNDLTQFWFTLVICGLIFGFMQAHFIARRLDEIAVSVKSWSRGDFSARSPEKPDDELGGLAKLLNEMAKKLQEVFAIKQDLAMSEERNRIARDLHDSVKQQIFGLGMQLGAAKALLKTNPEATEIRLDEAENLLKQVQAELVDLIRELRPNDSENLSERLENYLQTWSRQNSISADFFADENVKISQTVENTLFKISQEALANITKHSRADKILIELKGNNASILFVISDNGIGFNSKNVQKGIGLETMRERAESLNNGAFSIDSENKKGVKIKVSFQV
jgi:two-component system, NarL family, sensor histidine kinase LiaS